MQLSQENLHNSVRLFLLNSVNYSQWGKANMKTIEAVRRRINELIAKSGKSVTAFSLDCLLTPSTIFEFIYGRTKCPSIETIKHICYGAGIKLKDFFDADYFDDFGELFE